MPSVHGGRQVGHPHVLDVRVVGTGQFRLGRVDVGLERPSTDPVVDLRLD